MLASEDNFTSKNLTLEFIGFNRVSINEERRRCNGNADNEDDVPMRND